VTDKPPSPSQIDPQTLTIRLVQKEDLQALEWEGVYQKYRRMYARLFEDSQFGKILMWLVESPQKEVIGQVFVMLNSGERDAADGYTRAYVFAFRVKPQWRNRGIGTLLMAHVEKELLKKGFSFATLNVAKANPDARRLYERLGYKVVRSKPGIWSFRDDTGTIQHVNEPAWRMVKRLD
jgi:ribosomal protein S18 acetylase RimI-like enzyme